MSKPRCSARAIVGRASKLFGPCRGGPPARFPIALRLKGRCAEHTVGARAASVTSGKVFGIVPPHRAATWTNSRSWSTIPRVAQTTMSL
jgi:hypothetical protein